MTGSHMTIRTSDLVSMLISQTHQTFQRRKSQTKNVNGKKSQRINVIWREGRTLWRLSEYCISSFEVRHNSQGYEV